MGGKASLTVVVEQAKQHDASLRPPEPPSEPGGLLLPRQSRSGRFPWPRPACTVPWWWWWEIGASTISIVSIIMLLALLIWIDRTHARVDVWPLSIRPNTLISISTTTARTSMMVSVTSCISQLKWRHYLLGPDRLHYLQIFDDASRGPWGAAKALLAVRTKALLIMVLAVVTLVSLTVEPMAQQILDVTEDEILINNDTAKIAVADVYNSASLRSDGTVTPNALFVRSALLRAISGDTFNPNFYCPAPAKYCSWSNFTSLGVCRDTRNLTGHVSYSCSSEPVPWASHGVNQTRCIYEIPLLTAHDEWNASINHLRHIEAVFPGNESDPFDARTSTKTLFNSTGKMDFQDSDIPRRFGYHEGVTFAFLRVPDNRRFFGDLLQPEISMTRWYYCAQTFSHVSGTPSTINLGNWTSRALEYVSPGSYKDRPGTQIYNVSYGQVGSIWHALANLLDYKPVFLRPTEPRIANQEKDDLFKVKREGTVDFDFGQFLYEANDQKLEEILERITIAATNLIRSGNPGDNLGTVLFPGAAYYKELFYLVRWGWVIIPVVEVIVIAGLLGLSIRQTRAQPLLKESVAAYLFHGLQGWSDSELDALLPAGESMESLEEVSKGMVASLTRDGDGRMRFKRAP